LRGEGEHEERIAGGVTEFPTGKKKKIYKRSEAPTKETDFDAREKRRRVKHQQ